MTACRYVGRHEPRILPQRHAHGCDGEECPGCLPCPERHCCVCARAHADGACPECIAATRDDLAAIRLMCGALPTEVEHRGIEGEAMMLLGPVADIEARSFVEASYLAGRLPEGWIEAAHGRDCPILRNEACVGCAGGERHPLTVLGTWEMVWRDYLEHDTDECMTIDRSAGYLDRNLAYMAGIPDVPFEDVARDLRRCRSHLEDVLHDGEQVETGAPCPTCRVREPDRTAPPLVREYVDGDASGARDRWVCPRCKSSWGEADYRLRVGSDHIDHAEELTATDMVARTRVAAGTIRRWASKTTRRIDGETVTLPPLLRPSGRSVDGRKLYRVDDVLRLRDGDREAVA